MCFFLKKFFICRVTPERLIQLSELICELFPSERENKNDWYEPYTKEQFIGKNSFDTEDNNFEVASDAEDSLNVDEEREQAFSVKRTYCQKARGSLQIAYVNYRNKYKIAGLKKAEPETKKTEESPKTKISNDGN